MPNKVYAVARGRKTGLFDNWENCLESTKGFSGAIYKSFSWSGLDLAEKYLIDNNVKPVRHFESPVSVKGINTLGVCDTGRSPMATLNKTINKSLNIGVVNDKPQVIRHIDVLKSLEDIDDVADFIMDMYKDITIDDEFNEDSIISYLMK